LAGQHFAKHYPASMKRVDKLRKESNEDNNTTGDTISTNSIKNVNHDVNVSTEWV